MNNESDIRAALIKRIIDCLKSAAKAENREFDAIDTFFTLTFKSTDALQGIARAI